MRGSILLDLRGCQYSSSCFCLTESFTDAFFCHWFRYVVVDGVPSKGTKVMIGTGANPPSSATASEGALEYSKKLEASASYRNQTYYIPPYVPTN